VINELVIGNRGGRGHTAQQAISERTEPRSEKRVWLGWLAEAAFGIGDKEHAFH
jgi:hypothetical protein